MGVGKTWKILDGAGVGNLPSLPSGQVCQNLAKLAKFNFISLIFVKNHWFVWKANQWHIIGEDTILYCFSWPLPSVFGKSKKSCKNLVLRYRKFVRILASLARKAPLKSDFLPAEGWVIGWFRSKKNNKLLLLFGLVASLFALFWIQILLAICSCNLCL